MQTDNRPGGVLRTSLGEDTAVEQWLRTEVVATYDAMQTGTYPVFTSQEIRERIAALHHQTHAAPTA
ncbi:MAG: hypothetical protein Q4G30_08170 [Actinomycetaceae bacterium]|nr:hypothetical protein [Actinomycetaceae bacterium]